MDNLVAVGVGDCTCPGSPHPDGDVVQLRPRLDLRGGFRVKRRLLDLNQAAIRAELAAMAPAELAKLKAEAEKSGQPLPEPGQRVDQAELEIALAEAYLLEGVFSWNLVDAAGAELPVSPETIRERLFSDYSRAEAAADKADDLYRPPVFDPLAARALALLQPMPTSGSTSPTNGATHKPKRRGRSKPSSTSTSPTAGTATTTR